MEGREQESFKNGVRRYQRGKREEQRRCSDAAQSGEAEELQ